jgi:type IV secretion system protein VirB5
MTTQSSDPYIKARTEWQMLNDNISASKENWKRVTYLLLFVCIGQLWLVYYAINKAHVTPYVVNVDDLGRARAITEIKEAPLNDERVIRAFVYQYIDRVWSVASDPQVIKMNLENAYKDSTESVQKNFLDAFQQEDNPLDYMKNKGTKFIEPTVFLRQSENTYSIEWREIDRNYDNQVLGETRFKGLISVVQVPPTNKDSMEDNPDNPFGLYVTSVSWAKLS